MDARTALKQNTVLRFTNAEGGAVSYRITGEIGRGGSSIVYDGEYTNNMGLPRIVRIRECYPFRLSLSRSSDGSLSASGPDRAAFEREKQEFREAFRLNNDLFMVSGLTNSIANTFDIYQANHTYYVISTYLEGRALSDAIPASLRDCVRIVRSTANAIRRIHEQGYLYLDIKPSNILVIEGTTELIQLYDFDSLMRIGGESGTSGGRGARISYTKGFSALEQQQGAMDRIGKHTDVYGIGALLFWLLFGRTAEAPDCSSMAVFSWDKMNYGGDYSDRLFPALTEFFHRTLANYWPDRYPDMDQVIAALDRIEPLTAVTAPYIVSSRIEKPWHHVDRREELSEIDDWINTGESNLLFITGMGGIGKSTLIRQYLTGHRDAFDAVLYLYYHDSIRLTIADDDQLQINTVEKLPEETTEEYFHRKMREIRKLVSKTPTLLVIDNFDGDLNEDLRAVRNADWKIIILTRCEFPRRRHIRLDSITDQDALRELFQVNMGRELQPGEAEDYQFIVQAVRGHTLTLELIARQIAASHVNVKEAADLVRSNGFADMTPAIVDSQRDEVETCDTVGHLIDRLFAAHALNEEERSLMKMLWLVDSASLGIQQFPGMLDPGRLERLLHGGWVEMRNGRFCLHPVIREAAGRWEWTKGSLQSVFLLMQGIAAGLEKDSPLWLRAAECAAASGASVSMLRDSADYTELLYQTVRHMPKDREDFIIKYSEQLLERDMDPKRWILTADYLVYIYLQKGDTEAAERLIRGAEDFVQKEKNNYVTAVYYDMLGDYEEYMAGGDYRRRSRGILRSVDCAIDAMARAARSADPDSGTQLARYRLSRANVLVRSGSRGRGPRKRREIDELYRQVWQEIGDKDSPEYLELQSSYYMSRAWYFTFIRPDIERMMQCVSEAREIAGKRSAPDLTLIDDILIPYADLLRNWDRFAESERVLRLGIDVCARHQGVLPYIRKQLDLYSYLADIFCEAGMPEREQELEAPVEALEHELEQLSES